MIKLQAPNPKLQRNSKFQIPEASRGQLGLPATAEPLLVLGASLGFGAWCLEVCKIPKPTVNAAAPTQSGDSEDSVAAVQDARALTHAALGSWSNTRSINRRTQSKIRFKLICHGQGMYPLYLYLL
jgi:hypothetical protein